MALKEECFILSVKWWERDFFVLFIDRRINNYLCEMSLRIWKGHHTGWCCVQMRAPALYFSTGLGDLRSRRRQSPKQTHWSRRLASALGIRRWVSLTQFTLRQWAGCTWDTWDATQLSALEILPCQEKIKSLQPSSPIGILRLCLPSALFIHLYGKDFYSTCFVRPCELVELRNAEKFIWYPVNSKHGYV